MAGDKNNITAAIYLGLDVQVRRPCTYYALDQDLRYVTSGVLEGSSEDTIRQSLRALAEKLLAEYPGGLVAGIDAPGCRCLPPGNGIGGENAGWPAAGVNGATVGTVRLP